MNKRDHKRLVEIEKSREEFQCRLAQADWWENQEKAAIFRVVALAQFAPGKSDRQIFNHAKINLY